MAHTIPASQKFLARFKVTTFVTTADHSSATDVGWVDMRDYSEITIITVATVLSGNGLNGTGAFKILINTASDGTGDETTVKTHSTVTPDAVNDSMVLSVTAEEIAAESGDDGKLYRYVSANINADNSGDDTASIYIQTAKHSKLDLTADSIA